MSEKLDSKSWLKSPQSQPISSASAGGHAMSWKATAPTPPMATSPLPVTAVEAGPPSPESAGAGIPPGASDEDSGLIPLKPPATTVLFRRSPGFPWAIRTVRATWSVRLLTTVCRFWSLWNLLYCSSANSAALCKSCAKRLSIWGVLGERRRWGNSH